MPTDESTRVEAENEGRPVPQTVEPPSPATDPSETVADASRRASEALGTRDQEAWKADLQDDGLLGRMTYWTSYGLSYGLVYPAVLLARLVPKENAMVHGLTDGATAARDEAPKLWRTATMSDVRGDEPATAARYA